ncbi:MAG: ATP-binding protein [Bacteroidales bacterium]|nr:ATP-binding protein [Bacteroidales bacterium]
MKIPLRKIFLFVFLSLWLNILTGQNFNDLKFERYTNEDGLPGQQVSRAYQDSEGYLWFCTRGDGITRYDGLNFKNFAPIHGDSLSLDGYVYNYIFEDSSNRLWFGGTTGISIFKRDTEKFHNLKINKNANRNSCRWIYEDSKGKIWIGTTNGLYQVITSGKDSNDFRFVHFPFDIDNTKQPARIITAIQEDDNRVLWIATRSGLFYFDLSKQEFISINHAHLSSTNIIYITLKQGYLWVAAAGGIYKVELNNSVYTEPNITQYLDINDPLMMHLVPEKLQVTCITFDKGGNLWASSNVGLLILENPTGGPLTPQKFNINRNIWYDNTSLTHQQALWVYFDDYNIAWIATRGGISKYDKYRYKFKNYIHKQGNDQSLTDGYTNSIAENSTGKYAVVSHHTSFDIFHKKTNKIIAIPKNFVKGFFFNRVVCDKDDNFWLIGNQGRNNGILIKITIPNDFFDNPDYNKIKAKLYSNADYPELANVRKINSIFIDSEERIWFAANDRTLIIRKTVNGSLEDIKIGKAADLMAVPNDIDFVDIDFLCENKHGDIWMNRNEQFYKYDKENNSIVKTKIVVNNAVCFVFDRKNDSIMWVATRFNGLKKINVYTQESQTYNTNTGLPSNKITGIMEDHNRNLWIGTSRGICKLNLINNLVSIYTTRDGIQGDEFVELSYFHSKDGGMYFGGLYGFNYFNPEITGTTNQYKPTVKFTGLNINGIPVGIGESYDDKVILTKHIQYTDAFTLYPSMKKFTLEFAALSYSSSYKNKYKYMLKGYDKDWVTTTTSKPYASYSNLDEGSYTFLVKASNSDNIWNDIPATITIRVIPPFYKRMWFRFFIIFVFLLISASIYRIRLHQLKKKQLELEKLVSERTAELKYANFELHEQKEEILQQNKSIHLQNEQIHNKNQQLVIISEFGQKLTATLSTDAINSMTYNYISRLMDVHAFGIGIIKEDDKQVVYPVFFEKGRDVRSVIKDFSDACSLTIWSYFNQKPVVINNYEEEYQNYIPCTNIPDEGGLAMSRIRLPLTLEKKKIGILVVNSLKKNAYSEEDFTNLWTLASYLAIALDNASTYEVLTLQQEQMCEAHVALEEQKLQIANQAEELRKQKLKLEELNATKDKLFSIIGHDLKNPFQGIMGFSELVHMRVERQPIEKTRSMIDSIKNISKSAYQLLENLLLWARAQTNQSEFKPVDTSLYRIVSNVFSLVFVSAKEKNNKLENEVDENMEFVCDENMLETIVRNLVNNANKFTENGTITVGCNKSEDSVRINVTDTGIGIPESKIDILFNIDETKSIDGTAGEKGTGLGLIICKEFVEKHGGKMWVESKVCEGSTFYVEIPNINKQQGL